jgi:hypothetical protein
VVQVVACLFCKLKALSSNPGLPHPPTKNWDNSDFKKNKHFWLLLQNLDMANHQEGNDKIAQDMKK